MSELNKLVDRIAAAYVTLRGDRFTHTGVTIPLERLSIAMAVHNNIVDTLINHELKQGNGSPHGAVLEMLGYMVTGDQLTPFGVGILDDMGRTFCAEVREMLNAGKDPVIEVAGMYQGRLVQ